MNMEIAKSILEAENEDGVAILCTARDCVHFREFRCDAKEIHIENHPKIGSAATRCDSYQCYQ